MVASEEQYEQLRNEIKRMRKTYIVSPEIQMVLDEFENIVNEGIATLKWHEADEE